MVSDIGIVFKTKENTTYTRWFSQSDKVIDYKRYGDETHICILNIMNETFPQEHDKPLFVVRQHMKKW